MKNNSIISIEKFIAAIVIMTFHMYLFDEKALFTIGVGGWIFVELFVIITGFYTSKRFCINKCENIYKSCLFYTIRKWLKIVPFSIIAVAIQWGTLAIFQIKEGLWGIKDVLFLFLGDMPFEMLLINTHKDGVPFVEPLWYLVVLFFLLPFFIMFLFKVERYLKVLVSLLFCLVYYGIFGVENYPRMPMSIFRMAAALFIGYLIFEISNYISNTVERNTANQLLVNAVAMFSLLIAILFVFMNIAVNRIILILICINLVLVLPSIAFPTVNSKAFDYLGIISVPIFVFNYPVGTMVELFIGGSMITKIVCYYLITAALSIVATYVFDRLKPFDGIINKLKY